MRLRAILVVSLLGTAAAGQVLAAIPEPHVTHKARARMVAAAKAAEPAPARQMPVSPPTVQADRFALLERVLRQRDNMWSAQVDDLHARVYEVVGQVQLVVACLIGSLLTMFVWLASITRQVTQLAAEMRAERSGGFG